MNGSSCHPPVTRVPDADRFHTDVSGEEYLARKESHQRKMQAYENLRQQRAAREEQRWQRIEEHKREEEEFWDRQRESGVKVSLLQSSHVESSPTPHAHVPLTTVVHSEEK